MHLSQMLTFAITNNLLYSTSCDEACGHWSPTCLLKDTGIPEYVLEYYI